MLKFTGGCRNNLCETVLHKKLLLPERDRKRNLSSDVPLPYGYCPPSPSSVHACCSALHMMRKEESLRAPPQRKERTLLVEKGNDINVFITG